MTKHTSLELSKKHKKQKEKLLKKQQKEMSDFLSGKKTLEQILKNNK